MQWSERVAELGFFAWGACRPGEVADRERVLASIAAGRHAGMGYLERHAQVRCDVRLLAPWARSVLVFLRSYAWPAPPRPRSHAWVAAYARGLDYHASMRRDLAVLAAGLEGYRTRVFVDTGPIIERYWARAAGLASLGKNTCALARGAGSLFCIGVVLTDAPFPVEGREPEDLCGSCDLCLRACPTGALVAPHELDARRCLSYLTIEHRGPIPREFRLALGDTLFGCDRCQQVCPHNGVAAVRIAGHEDFRPLAPFAAPSLADVLWWEERVFDALAVDRPVGRAGWRGFLRNALIAAAAAGERRLIERFRRLERDPALGALADELLATTPR